MSIASIGTDFCESVRVHVPQYGPWYAEVVMLGAPTLSGQVTLSIGTLDLVGTVTQAGTRGEQSFARIVAGAGAWGTQLPAKAYHNDAQVKRKLVAEDAARECGETLETITDQTRVGVHYVRRTGPASRALEGVFGAAWHVGYDGVTRIGERASQTPADDIYTVVDVQPADRVVTLAMDDVASVVVGSVLTQGLDESMVVRELEIRIDADEATVVAWCGGTASSAERIADSLRTIQRRESAKVIHGIWRYRVSQMDGDRVKLQAISRAADLPDVLPVDMYPGMAGLHAVLTNGAEVLVQFIEGSPTMPVITHFVGKGGPGHEPSTITIDATSQIKIGAVATSFAALATKVDTEFQRLWTVLTTWIPPLAPTIDNGAALKTAATTAYSGVQSTAATLVKVE